MSNLSGYDSEVVGFYSISRNKKPNTTTSTQTTEFHESETSSQTIISTDRSSNVTPDDLNDNELTKEYPPPGLNEFLRKVVPGVMEQLDLNEQEILDNSTDSEDEETISAKLFQQLSINELPSLGDGDHERPCILSLSWSSAGNSLAVSIGFNQHENWCNHSGLIKIYTVKRSAGDKLMHSLDICEKNCITVVRYHPSVAAIMAYATISGEVVICNLRNSLEEGLLLTSPGSCHGSRRVTFLQWADAPLANTYLTIQITNTGKRRNASDQVLFSSGSDGNINVWQVNSNLKVFENILTYFINGSRKMAIPDISCFDFIKSYPLRPCDEKVAEDLFVVGTSCGQLYLCKIKGKQIVDSNSFDPVYEIFEGHSTCVLSVAFSFQRPGMFASLAMDSELRLYDVHEVAPLKVLCLDVPVSCMCWLPNNPCVVILGKTCDTHDKSQSLCVYNVSSGRVVPVEGLLGGATVTALAVNNTGSCRIAAGDIDSTIRVWDLPTRCIKLSQEDLDF